MADQQQNNDDPIESGQSVSGKKWEYVEKSATEDQESVEQEKAAVEEVDESGFVDADEEPLSNLSYDELMDKLKKAQKESAANFERVARAQAEMKNIQNSARKDVESARKFALKGFVKELLAVIDNLERSLDAVSEDKVTDEVKTIVEGVQLTQKSLLSCVEKFGVEQLNPVGDTFNPEMHEAISMLPNPDVPANTVLQVLQKGYLLNQRLIRPAMVIVSQS